MPCIAQLIPFQLKSLELRTLFMRSFCTIFSLSPLSQPLEPGMRLLNIRPLWLTLLFSRFFGKSFYIHFPNYRWVWTSQMMYDVRFETGDFIHCFFKFLQLLMLGMSPTEDILISRWVRGICRKVWCVLWICTRPRTRGRSCKPIWTSNRILCVPRNDDDIHH